MSDEKNNERPTTPPERLIEKGIEPAFYQPAPEPPAPVENSGIGKESSDPSS